MTDLKARRMSWEPWTMIDRLAVWRTRQYSASRGLQEKS